MRGQETVWGHIKTKGWLHAATYQSAPESARDEEEDWAILPAAADAKEVGAMANRRSESSLSRGNGNLESRSRRERSNAKCRKDARCKRWVLETRCEWTCRYD